ncbi:MAG: RNA polymerase factor sigma-32 [Alphaproteobacteria bacterium]|jgi:RNA polymerase sigma-32 factor|nr:RNA polymerase factor sigma-32 [Alphaproteobacteria bacterium]MBP9868067.1 RNA polymerase factor sigma-32 [Alphaproteobacteria bacterium]
MAYMDDPATRKSNLAYIRTSMQEPLLEKEHEMELALRWRENHDEKALHEMIRSYTRLVVAAAAKFRNYGLPMGDLIQEGNLGLMQAASKFEPERGFRFSTYAAWWVRASIQDYVLRNWSIVRTGTTSAQKSLFFNLRRLRSRIEGASTEHGLTTEGREKISKLLGVSSQEVQDMEGRMAGADQSLNATIGLDGEDDYQSLLADDRPNPEEVVIGIKDSQTRSQWLESALKKLSEREQRIIKERHLRHETVTLEDLGKKLGVSKERVRQLESRAMEKLKDHLMSHAPNAREVLTGRA